MPPFYLWFYLTGVAAAARIFSLGLGAYFCLIETIFSLGNTSSSYVQFTILQLPSS